MSTFCLKLMFFSFCKALCKCVEKRLIKRNVKTQFDHKKLIPVFEYLSIFITSRYSDNIFLLFLIEIPLITAIQHQKHECNYIFTKPGMTSDLDATINYPILLSLKWSYQKNVWNVLVNLVYCNITAFITFYTYAGGRFT